VSDVGGCANKVNGAISSTLHSDPIPCSLLRLFSNDIIFTSGGRAPSGTIMWDTYTTQIIHLLALQCLLIVIPSKKPSRIYELKTHHHPMNLITKDYPTGILAPSQRLPF
jgi:hypothetical protein